MQSANHAVGHDSTFILTQCSDMTYLAISQRSTLHNDIGTQIITCPCCLSRKTCQSGGGSYWRVLW